MLPWTQPQGVKTVITVLSIFSDHEGSDRNVITVISTLNIFLLYQLNTTYCTLSILRQLFMSEDISTYFIVYWLTW